MTETHRTLCAIDFSPSSLAALDFALLLARKEAGASIHVTHAMGVPVVPAMSGELLIADDYDVRVQAALEKEVRARVAERTIAEVPMDVSVVIGQPASAIIEQAKTRGAERIVIGARGPSLLGRLLLGSVADRLAHTSPVELIIVPERRPDSVPRTRIRDIVCATDFSSSSEKALLRAVAIAKAHGARVHLVHAWEVAPYVERMPELRASIERDLAQVLETTAQRHEAPGLPILRHLRRGHPATEIVASATGLEADLLIVGSTGKRGLDRVLLGSVAERIARTSPVPVLIAR